MEITKTTLNLPTRLLQKAKVFAVQNKLTLTDLFIQGLEQRLSESLDYSSTKPSLAQFLKDNPSPFKAMSNKEKDEIYRQAMEQKHGSHLS